MNTGATSYGMQLVIQAFFCGSAGMGQVPILFNCKTVYIVWVDINKAVGPFVCNYCIL